MDDDELIVAAARGDDGALRVLFSRHAPWLASRLGRVLPAAAVEDVLQETFVAVWQGAARYRPDGRAGAWLWGIAKRQAALWLRRAGQPPLPPVDTVAPDDPESAAVDRVEIAEAVASLSGEEQRLWRLMFVQDRSVADVARRLGVPQGTVKSRAYRIRRLLRAALRQGGA